MVAPVTAPQPTCLPARVSVPRPQSPTGPRRPGPGKWPLPPDGTWEPPSSSWGSSSPLPPAPRCSEDHTAGLPGRAQSAPTQALAGQALLGLSTVIHAEEQILFVVSVQHKDFVLVQGWKRPGREGSEFQQERGCWSAPSPASTTSRAPLGSPPGEDKVGSASGILYP